jgi:hypothetical protein
METVKNFTFNFFYGFYLVIIVSLGLVSEIKSFPIVFFNGEYIGGFAETKQFMEKRQAFASL